MLKGKRIMFFYKEGFEWVILCVNLTNEDRQHMRTFGIEMDKDLTLKIDKLLTQIKIKKF